MNIKNRNLLIKYFLILIIILVGFLIGERYLLPELKTLIIINNYDHTEVGVTEDELNKYREKFIETKGNLWESGETFIINNSDETIYLESVDYSTSVSYNPFRRTSKINISANSTHVHYTFIRFLFKDPPSSITVTRKRGREKNSTQSAWHLHR